MALRIRRGLEADRLSVTPDAGEFLYTTDTKEVYIGDGSTAGGTLIGGAGSLFITSILDSANIDLGVTSGVLMADITDTAVTPNTYGGATNIPQITVDQKGRVTSVTDIPITLSDYQLKRIVVSTNTTAVLDGAYTLVATSTFTDPTPAEGKGFSVFIRNGTATIGGNNYSTVGTIVWRVFHSGSWANYVLVNETQLATKQDTLLISSATASNSAVIDFTLPSGYDYFELFIEHLIPQTNATSLFLRVSIDGGATFLSGASDYEVHRNILSGSGGITYAPSFGLAAQVAPIGNLIGNTSGRFFRASFRIFDPSDTTQNKNITGEAAMQRSDGQPLLLNLSARVFNTSPVNAIRLFMSSGNIATGEFKLFGYKS